MNSHAGPGVLGMDGVFNKIMDAESEAFSSNYIMSNGNFILALYHFAVAQCENKGISVRHSDCKFGNIVFCTSRNKTRKQQYEGDRDRQREIETRI